MKSPSDLKLSRSGGLIASTRNSNILRIDALGNITVEFNDLGDSTEVVLKHELFPDAEATANHEKGWTSCLNRLERLFG